MIRQIRRGRSPNCSATGSVVGIALLSAIAAAAVVNAFADRFMRWTGRPDDPDATPTGDPAGGVPSARREADGGIVAWQDPAALLFVDGAGLDAAVAAGARVVGTGVPVSGALTAPTEVHVAVTDRCPAACSGCYLDAGPDRRDEPARAVLLAELRRLAEMGVFEIALGGGEAVLRDDLVALAEAIRALGMVPNLTTSGFGLTAARAARMSVFGQVNVSLDGLGDTYAAVRGWDGAGLGLTAIDRLVAAGVRTGVNTVLTRANFHTLDALAEVLAGRGVTEWQWLRFKPAGRGAAAYATTALTPDQADTLFARALDIEARTGLTVRFDCALVPFLVGYGVPVERLASLGVAGCPGGHSLWTRTAQGRWGPCSFAPATDSGDWARDAQLEAWRRRAADPPEPCASCEARAVCRGGCRIVAAHLTGDPLAPDPECPRVRA